MREDFLHFIWKHRKFTSKSLTTTDGENVTILHLGQHNQLAGPDFFNAKIEIDDQLWAGNVEIHLKSSDWYVHGHENDVNYDNVILHVVWEENTSVFRKDGSVIPCLELKNIVSAGLIEEHEKLMQKKKFINCESDFNEVEVFSISNWYERLFIERLETKSDLVLTLLNETKNDWEKVLFCLLMKNFGLNHNGEVFLDIAKKLDFAIFRKVKHDVLKSESLLFGMARLLEDEIDSYQIKLKNEHNFLAKKFQFTHSIGSYPNFYGLRPNNFPTIRLSQLANLYAKNENLFQKVVEADDAVTLRELFKVAASKYWNTHYVFGRTTSNRSKKITNSFIDLLIINTVIPLKFCYAKKVGKSVGDDLFRFAESLKAESNSIIDRFDSISDKTKNAFQSQAKIQLYKKYCVQNQCLKCVVGNKLLIRNN